MKPHSIVALLCLLILFVASVASAATPESNGVPPSLSEWVEWVKERNPEWRCARVGGAAECVWPGRIRYTVGEQGGEFELEATVLKRDRVPLPSTSELYPYEITVTREGGEEVEPQTGLENGELFLLLAPGEYSIRGKLAWDTLPRELPLPRAYGVFEVNSENGALQYTRQGGALIQQASGGGEQVTDANDNVEANGVIIVVARRFHDGSPMVLETALQLTVSGEARVLSLGQVLIPGALPVQSSASVPHFLSPTGELTVQVAAGVHHVSVTAVLGQPVTSLAAPTVSVIGWPEQEFWSWVPDPRFRSVTLGGALPIDPSQTPLPEDWRSGAAYVVPPGAAVELTELRRGTQSPAPNQLTLVRALWLDHDGGAYTVVDTLSGVMNRGTRLNALPELRLGRATVETEPAMITLDPTSGAAGVELRSNSVQLEAVSRIENTHSLPAVGWAEEVNTASYSLNLPPAWRLLHVRGATTGGVTWVESWSLLGVFLALLIVAGAYKLFHFRGALLSGVFLAVSHGEVLAPKILILYLLLTIAWTRFTESRGVRWYLVSRLALILTASVLTLQTLTFIKLQCTELLFPQLDPSVLARTSIQALLALPDADIFLWPLVLVFLAVLAALFFWVFRDGLTGIVIIRGLLAALFAVAFAVTLSVVLDKLSEEARHEDSTLVSAHRSQVSSEMTDQARSSEQSSWMSGDYYQRKAVVAKPEQAKAPLEKNLNTGPAVPTWSWNRISLDVPGPVNPAATIGLVLLSPAVNRAVNLFLMITAFSLLLLLLKAVWGMLVTTDVKWGEMFRRHVRASALNVVLVLALTLSAGECRAEYPPNFLLEELQARLQREQCQVAECSTIDQLSIEVVGEKMTLQGVASSDGPSAITLPGAAEFFVPSEILRNGQTTSGARSAADGSLQLLTEPGRNRFEVRGTLTRRGGFTLKFPQRVSFTEVRAEGWLVEGISPAGLVQEGVRFSPKRQTDTDLEIVKADRIREGGLPNWFMVRRDFVIGEQITIDLTVRRMGGNSGASQLSVPLLKGEQLISEGERREGETVLVRFAAGESEAAYRTTMPFVSELSLVAAPPPNASEVWSVRCESMVRCAERGLKETALREQGGRELLWYPFPGESVQISATKLSSVPGDSLTIDQVENGIRWGAEQLDGTLLLTVRTTRESPLELVMPEGVSARGIAVNGVQGSGVIQGQRVQVLLTRGKHSVSLDYAVVRRVRFFERAPRIELSAPLHNVTVTVTPSADRWLLLTGGAVWGPAVLFWGKLLLVVLGCLFLHRCGLLPMGAFSAAFLGWGLATASILWLWLPLLWLGGLALIPRYRALWERLARPWRTGTLFIVALIAIVYLIQMVRAGLVIEPPMLIQGSRSTASQLQWFIDHAGLSIPPVWTLSLPIWCWRVLALLWSTWLVFSILAWLRLTFDLERSESSAAPVLGAETQAGKVQTEGSETEKPQGEGE